MPDWLPPLITMSDYGGNWDRYLAAIYAQFKADFLDRTPSFRGTQLGLKRHPMMADKEATFWHMTSEGSVEDERTPDFRRCERIAWVAAIIENADDPAVKVWENERNGERRILLWLEAHDFIVVLSARKGYILPWTAFYLEHEHRRRKYSKEFEAYKKQEPPLERSGTVTPSTHGG